MIRRVCPGRLRGEALVPSSKSHMQRLLLCAALADQETRIAYRGDLPDDCQAMLSCSAALGGDITIEKESITVAPARKSASRAFSCGESGTALRFLLPVCAATGGGEITYAGRERPQEALIAALSARGARISHEKGAYSVSGRLESGVFALPGHISSQYVSGLLLALPLLQGDSEVRLTTPLVSAGYLDMTLDTLRAFGIAIDRRGDVFFAEGNQAYRSPGATTCEGDCSAGAVWLAARAMGHEVTLSGLPTTTRQPDAMASDVFKQTDVDLSLAPDLMPLLAAVAALRRGRTRITGIKRLSGKESDRPRAMAEVLQALGIVCELSENTLVVEGGQPRGGAVSGARDHRVVMALALLATKCASYVDISDAEAVAKSYPAFWRDFDRLTEERL